MIILRTLLQIKEVTNYNIVKLKKGMEKSGSSGCTPLKLTLFSSI